MAKSTGGLAVRAFAVRPNPMERGGAGFGAEQTTLRAAGFNPAARTVDAVCVNGASRAASVAAESGVRSVELAVEVVKPSDATASGQALDITYSIQGEPHVMRWPFGVTLCRPGLKDYVTECP